MATKQLYRHPAKGKIAGVCAGLAEYFGIDVTVLRVMTLAVIIFTGLVPGLIVYFGAAIVMPTKESSRG